MRLGRPIIAAALHQASLLRRPLWQPVARRGLSRALCTAEEPRTAGSVAAADAAVTTVDSEAPTTATHSSIWEALGRLLPHANLNRLVAQFPGVLECEPSALLSRVNALADALPGQNVLRAVERCPTILQLSEEELRDAAERGALPVTRRRVLGLPDVLPWEEVEGDGTWVDNLGRVRPASEKGKGKHG